MIVKGFIYNLFIVAIGLGLGKHGLDKIHVATLDPYFFVGYTYALLITGKEDKYVYKAHLAT